MNKESISFVLEQQTELENQLKQIIAKEDLIAHKALLEASARHLDLDYLDLAAALLCLLSLGREKQTLDINGNKLTQEKQRSYELINAQMERYRIEVGRIHKITIPVIKKILVDISGVEHRKIGYIDIFEYYTVLSLPMGMPSDILQLLKEAAINNRELDIKRLNGYGKKYRHDKTPRRGTQRHFISTKKKTA
jgi:hypothetical protein